MTNKLTLSYAAGIIDGEGSLQISKNGKHFTPKIEMTTTDGILAPFFKETFGGALTVRKRNQKNPKWKDAQMWYLEGHEKIIVFLEIIIPYLLVKKRQAEIVLQFARSRYKNFRTARHLRGYTEEELSLYEELKIAHA